MTVDPDPLYERTDTEKGAEGDDNESKALGTADAHSGANQNETLREVKDEGGTKALEGDRKSKLRRIQEAKEGGE